MAKEIVSTHENPFLKISYKNRIQTLASHPALTEKTDLTQTEQQSYVDVVISIQHMAAEIPHDEEKAKLFSDIFAESLDNMARKNILLPLAKEVISEENKNFKTYITEILRIIKELDALKTQKLKPSAEKSSEYVSIIISFQRFLTQKYNQTENRTDYKYIEPSIAFLSSAIKALSIFNIKFPSEQLEFATGKVEVAQSLPKTKEHALQTEPPQLTPFEARLLEVQQKFPRLPKKAQEVLADQLVKRESVKREKIEKKKQELLQQQQQEQQRKEAILAKLEKIKAGDKIKLLNSKGIVTETHTVKTVLTSSKQVRVEAYNHKTKKSSELFRYFDSYTDKNTAPNVEIEEKKEVDWSKLTPGTATIENLVEEEEFFDNPSSGRRELKLFKKANQDDMGYDFINDYRDKNQKALRCVLADGSGGSSSIQLSDKVRNSMRRFIQKTVFSDPPSSLRESAFNAANYIYELISTDKMGENPNYLGYGTFIAAEILTEKIDLCWRGDTAALLWKNGTFQHERSACKGNINFRGPKSQFQLQSFIENRANRLQSVGQLDNGTVTTRYLDVHRLANKIDAAVGNSELKNKEQVSHFEITKQDIIDSGAEFMILATDGAQPNTMIAMEKDNTYNQRVNEIMQQLSAGDINTNQAAAEITEASRSINDDPDDISVMVIDLRQWKSVI